MIIDASLIKRLNRLFSGPLASRRGPHTQKLKKRFVNKFRFQQTSWNSSFDKYQKNEYKLFSFLNIESLSDRNRRSRYREFEMMEFMPELSSALDIYADEMTSFTALNPILKIDSPDPNIKQILNTLFYDVLDIQNNLWGWTRNTIKYGDFFLYLHLDPDLGVKFSVGLPQDEIMRIEGLDPSNPNYVKYRWETEGHEFENFQIVHFRISSNERNAPYGVSVLENARRIFRQLTLMEDTIISYRVVRAPERRVFYIDVQGINPKDQEVYFEEIKNKLKRNQIVDPDSGDITSRYNPMPVHFMTPIPLLDGRTITIKQLSEEFEQGKQNYVYSVQDNTHSIVPGMVKWCGKNYTAKKIALVTLDNGGVVKTAPEHPFVMRDGSSKRADELVSGDALMPLISQNIEIISETDVRLVASVQIIDEVADVYCMTVVGPNGENDRHNFGVSDYNTSCDGVDKYCNTLVFVNNSIEEDYFIATRGPQSGTKIDTLSGGEYNGGVDDVKYLRNKLFTAIKIPSSYLEDNENANGQEALTQKDVRFARTICRLQSFIVAELEKIAQIHLAVLGLPGDKLINFKLSLNNPSMIWDLQEMEFWGKKLELAASAESILDLNFVYKKFFNFSNEEIHNIILGRQTDAKNFAKIEKIKAAAEGGGDLGGLGGDLGGLDMGAGGELGLEELGAESEAGEDAGALLSAPGKRLEGRERKRLDGKGTYRRVINPGNEGDGDLGLGAGPLDRALKTTLPRTVSRGEERVLSGDAGLTSNLKEQIKKLSADAESLISEYREKRGKF